MAQIPEKVVNSLLDIVEDRSDKYVVASSSMEPVLNPGDKIEIEPVDPKEIKIGQIIVFRNEFDKLIVHRVIEKKGYMLITAGDNLRKYDDPVHVNDVAGKVKNSKLEKPLSKFLRFLRAVKRRFTK